MARSIGRAIVLLAAISCMSSTEPLGCGSFVGRADGAVADTLSGCAIFSMNQDTDEFGLLLTNGGLPPGASPVLKLFAAGGRPDAIPTTYSVAPIIGCNAGICGLAFVGQRRFQLAGSMSVTQSDTLNFAGSLDVIGTDSVGASLTIRGTFLAPCRGQKKPFEVQGDPNSNVERFTPCKPFVGRG